MADQMPNRSWPGVGRRHHLVVDGTEPIHNHALLSVYQDGDGPSVLLTAEQLREVAADLVARADLIEGGAG